VKDAFAKKFLVPGEIPLAARSHRFFGNLLLKAGHLMRSGVVVSGTVLQGGQELATSIQNGSSRLLISQYFLPESDPTERFRDTLGNKGFSAACDPTARCDLRSSIGDGHVHHMGSSSPANVSSKPASHLSNSAMVLRPMLLPATSRRV
jgi:hypothetical protein